MPKRAASDNLRLSFAKIAVFVKVLSSVLSFKSTYASPWQPTFQDKIANLRARWTAAVPNFLSLGHLFHMVALNDSLSFCVSPATQLFSKATSERRVYNGRNDLEACCLWFVLKTLIRRCKLFFVFAPLYTVIHAKFVLLYWIIIMN